MLGGQKTCKASATYSQLLGDECHPVPNQVSIVLACVVMHDANHYLRELFASEHLAQQTTEDHPCATVPSCYRPVVRALGTGATEFAATKQAVQ